MTRLVLVTNYGAQTNIKCTGMNLIHHCQRSSKVCHRECLQFVANLICFRLTAGITVLTNYSEISAFLMNPNVSQLWIILRAQFIISTFRLSYWIGWEYLKPSITVVLIGQRLTHRHSRTLELFVQPYNNLNKQILEEEKITLPPHPPSRSEVCFLSIWA